GQSRRRPNASTYETGGTQRFARRGRLVVRALRLADYDRAFVPLAGKKHRVVGLGAANRLGDGLASVVDDEVIASALLPGRDRAGLDLREDGRRVLEPRILLREHEQIGVPRRDLRERGSLRPVALAGAPKYRDELAARERP